MANIPQRPPFVFPGEAGGSDFAIVQYLNPIEVAITWVARGQVPASVVRYNRTNYLLIERGEPTPSPKSDVRYDVQIREIDITQLAPQVYGGQ